MKFAYIDMNKIKLRISGDEVVEKIEFVKDVKDIKTPNHLENAQKQIEEYLLGQREIFDFDFEITGTDFQVDVWNALLEIPYGETRSYKDIAIAIGNPDASRAVGNANNRNPLPIVIPCHRVIGANKKLTGYAGGIDIKKQLLELESRKKDA